MFPLSIPQCFGEVVKFYKASDALFYITDYKLVFSCEMILTVHMSYPGGEIILLYKTVKIVILSLMGDESRYKSELMLLPLVPM